MSERRVFVTRVRFEGDTEADLPKIQRVTPAYFCEKNGFSEENIRALAALKVNDTLPLPRRGATLTIRRVE